MTGAAPGPDRGFVLHAYPYRETSLLLQLWTRGHGRFAAVAKGAKRAKGAAKAMLLPFVPLDLSWFGRGDVKTLKLAEPNGLALPLSGGALMAGFYVNELLLKLIHRDDPHEGLWEAYAEAIESLRSLSLRSLGVPGLVAAEPALGAPRAVEPVLRKFELAMLRELGYAAELGHDVASGESIDPEGEYWYVAERGPIAWDGRPEREDAVKLRGLTLIQLERGEFDDPLTASQAKSLMRMLINRCLNGQELATRALVRDLQRLEGTA